MSEVEISGITCDFVEAMKAVHEECFAGDAQEVDIGDSLAFLLGVPRADMSLLFDAIMARIDRALPDDASRHVLVSYVFHRGVQAGVAAERRTRMDIP